MIDIPKLREVLKPLANLVDDPDPGIADRRRAGEAAARALAMLDEAEKEGETA